MTDDAGLRARIEAQVAARRASGSPPKGRRSTDDPPRRPLRSRVFKRGDGDVDADEPDEKFTLPEPDASFEHSWLRPAHPRPTQDRTPPRTAAPARVDLTKSGPASRPLPPGVRPVPAPPASSPPVATAPPVSPAPPASPDPAPEREDHDDAGPRVTRRARRALVRTLVVVVIATIATVLLRVFVVQPFYIPSESMEPTLHGCPGCNEDHVLVDKLSYRAHDIRSGDIVVFHRPPHAPSITDRVLIKRVIGRPGDVVELRNGRVFVNGLVLDEPYVNEACGPEATTPIPLNGRSKWTVPAGDVFVMGDNRCHSADSRVFGPITSSSVIGRAFAIIWPIGRIRLL